ncbi:hypothetical protein PIB30_081750 [Stylosanthes scabra]|uniref:MBD domain-containing protein n=2 Tax=Stylosanthes scabra TaxID=79078 RepID=A0ABU6ZQE3_9FABA|nr:hypothetical protein [Stylosanthes scabra]
MEDPSSGDCLPQGWTVEVKVRKNGRRDKYYIDPSSGYVFRSLKDVDRYLESGEIGRNAFKPKDNIDTELKADKFLPAQTTKPTSSVSMGLSSDSDRISNGQQGQKPACSGEYASTPISENTSSQCVVGAESTTSVTLQAESSDQIEGKVSVAERAPVPIRIDEEDSQEKQIPDDEQTKTEKSHDQKRKRQKKVINLPRRSSKRLAGIQLDPVPELVTRSRARRGAVEKSGQRETMENDDKFSNSLPNAAAKKTNAPEGGSETKCKSESAANMPQSTKGRPLCNEFSTPERLPNKAIEENGSNKNQECFSFWPQENHATMKDHADKVDAKLDYSHEFPLKELLQDPCIAFAIQTLTGVTFETSKTSQVSGESNNSEHSEAFTASTGGDDKGGCNVFSHPENYAIIPQEHAGAAETETKTNENRTGSSSSEKELDVSWMDPCIEFAIKTLTGSIPLDSDQSPKNCMQQQLSSSNTNHGDVAFNQKPSFKQSFVDPTHHQHSRNVGMGNSGGARIPHCGDDRRNVC